MSPHLTLDQRYEALLEVAESIVSQLTLRDLFRQLSLCLKRLVPFDGLSLLLYQPETESVRVYLVEADIPHKPEGIDVPISATPFALVMESHAPLYVPDIEQEHRYPFVTAMLRANGVHSFCVVPLETARRIVGSMNFGAFRTNAYRPDEIAFMREVGRLVAVAVENVLNYESAAEFQRGLASERDRLRLLLEINNAVVRHLDTPDLFRTVTSCLRRVFRVDMINLALYDPAANQLRMHVLDYPGNPGTFQQNQLIPIENTPAGLVFRERKARLFRAGDVLPMGNALTNRFVEDGFRCSCSAPLISGDSVLGTLNVVSFAENAFHEQDVDLLTQVAGQIAIALDNALAYRHIEELNAKLAQEKLYLEDEIRTEHRFEEIVGSSPRLRTVLQQVSTVAPADSTVLITGETGTGKEVIARAVHNLSGRKERTFVKVNCAAIPSGLLESELFGHEKGAFTGAITQRAGRFELAHGGTLFLDEVGEIPLELQPKLLRVLQEREFERLGSARTQRVDVRVVAATNRDLKAMVEAREFRADLYYRLNVFPIHVPALRERGEDIPLLVSYFAQQFARQMRKEISTVPAETMEAMCRYAWPGNVRELQNLVERAVILSSGPVLRVPTEELRATAPIASEGTLEEADRRHILQALEASNWVLAGPNGAAARLGLKRSTLQFRMQKLGIVRPR